MAFVLGTDLNTLQQQLLHNQSFAGANVPGTEAYTRLQSIRQAIDQIQKQQAAQAAAANTGAGVTGAGATTSGAAATGAATSGATNTSVGDNFKLGTTLDELNAQLKHNTGFADSKTVGSTSYNRIQQINDAIAKLQPPPTNTNPDPNANPNPNPNPTPDPNNTGAGLTNSGTGASIDPKDLQMLKDQITLGTQFGNDLINQYGLNGQFLGRVNTDPSANTQAAIEAMKAQAQNAGNFTPLEQEAIDRDRAALAGLSAPENAALRENAQAGLDRTMQTLLRRQAMSNAGSGIQGNALSARYNPIYRDRADQQRGLERDLLIQNIQEKDAARQAFTNLVSNRVDAANQRQTTANTNLFGASSNADQFSRAGQLANQAAAGSEAATRVGTGLGAMGTVSGLLGGFRAEDFAQKGFTEAQSEFQKALDANLKMNKDTQDLYNKIFAKLG